MRKGERKYKKRPDSAANAKPKIKFVGHGGRSNLLTDPFDGRSQVGKRYKQTIAALHDHLGGNLSLPEQALCDQAARLALLADISWGELIRSGMFEKGQLTGAFDAWLRASRDQRSVLQLIGLKRREKEVKDLSSYIKEQAE